MLFMSPMFYRNFFSNALIHTIWLSFVVLLSPVHARESMSLPAGVNTVLKKAQIPEENIHIFVSETDSAKVLLQHLAQTPVNPASLMKLVTTTAALDTLGPAFTWHTPVYIEGTIKNGTLQGNVYIRGSGDPHLVVERLWLMLRRLQGLGIQKIQGDIVLDRSAFDILTRDAASFDGEPLRPYNAAPDALLLNFKSILVHFSPDTENNIAHIHIEPSLAGVASPASIALSKEPCNDYRSNVRADWSDPLQIRFNGFFPASCGDKIWPIAYNAPASYAARTIAGMWQQLGGTLTGQVREGKVPSALKPVFDTESETLSETIRNINKYSNNVMAQQVFLTLSLVQNGTGTFDASRDLVQNWWRDKIHTEPPILENGSGLSRQERISAQGLGQLLQWTWRSPVMAELMSSLPVSGTDGTLKRSKAQSVAHLKTGSLRDVVGIAGFVDATNNKRRVLVVIINHPNASAARPALDALIDWTAQQP
jgi:serine-type D-Ala-D-Ala carboxypeptidase/endopeptidase (penicillin-binding protein 4)